MDWSERMNAAVEYIEENLAGEIDFNKAAEKAACSIFHFQRIFFAINGLTPAEYARRRKLTLAAMELAADNSRVIDVAMKYGYDSPNAFTRAFRQLHGTTPQTAREPGVMLTAYPRISFNIILKGGNDMDYKILKKPAFDVVGKRKRLDKTAKETPARIWGEFKKSKDSPALDEYAGWQLGPVTGALYMGIAEWTEGEMKYFTIAVEKSDKPVPPGFDTLHIPASTWAVFECDNNPAAVGELHDKIWKEWFPSSGYEYAGTPEFEMTVRRLQVWVPVVKKKEK